MMASFVASGLATAPARVFALASAPRAHEARNAALATTHRRRVRAVPSSTARWTAAPARGVKVRDICAILCDIMRYPTIHSKIEL